MNSFSCQAGRRRFGSDLTEPRFWKTEVDMMSNARPRRRPGARSFVRPVFDSLWAELRSAHCALRASRFGPQGLPATTRACRRRRGLGSGTRRRHLWGLAAGAIPRSAVLCDAYPPPVLRFAQSAAKTCKTGPNHN